MNRFLPIAAVTVSALLAAQGEEALGDLSPGPADSDAFRFARVGGTALLQTLDPTTSIQSIWRSNGTAAGTSLASSTPNQLYDTMLPFGDRALAVGLGPQPGPAADLIAIDSLTGVSTVLGSFTFVAGVGESSRLGNRIVFAADDGVNGFELWSTDGTVAGTNLIADMEPGPGSSFPGRFHRIGDEVFFFTLGSGFLEIWKTDGVQAQFETSVIGVPGSGFLRASAVAGGKLFFATQYTLWGVQVYVFDPATGVATVLISSSSVHTTTLETLKAFGDGVLFDLETLGFGSELHFSDGTLLGTGMVVDLAAGSDSSSPVLTDIVVGGRLLFRASDGVDVGLFATDGTAAGTLLVRAFDSTYTFLQPVMSLGRDRALIQTSRVGSTDKDVLETDGTATGTALFASDVTLYPQGHVHAGKAWFFRDLPATGREPWVLDIAPSAVRAGDGCGVGARLPSLEADVPRLGGALDLYGDDLPVGAVGALLISLLPDPPTRLGGTCISQLDSGSLSVLQFFSPVTDSWQYSLPLPNLPVLQGITIAAQAWFEAPSNPSGVETTNGLHLTFGS